MAVICNFKTLMNGFEGEKEELVGFVLNDFVPHQICIDKSSRLGNMTQFNNINQSFMLNDLARCLCQFIAFDLNKTHIIKPIVTGYTSVRPVQQQLLYNRVLLNLGFSVLRNESADNCATLFDQFYLNETDFFHLIF